MLALNIHAFVELRTALLLANQFYALQNTQKAQYVLSLQEDVKDCMNLLHEALDRSARYPRLSAEVISRVKLSIDSIKYALEQQHETALDNILHAAIESCEVILYMCGDLHEAHTQPIITMRDKQLVAMQAQLAEVM